MVTALLVIFPLVVYVLYVLRNSQGYLIKKIPLTVCVVYMIIMAFLLAAVPVEGSYDRENYAHEFLGYTNERVTDIGWGIYCSIISFFVGSNVFGFFLITATLYCFSNFLFCKKKIPREHVGYMLILLTGSMGFASYGCNTMRAGFAIALALVALVVQKKVFALLIIICSILTHFSILAPILSYLLTNVIKKKRHTEYIWIICLILSILQWGFLGLLSHLGLDVRIEQYSDADTVDYQVGFRLDFLLYSLLPIYISNLWMRKFHYHSCYYEKIYRTYLLSNSIWLLAMRIPYTDRVAYLSWFMMPYLALYPLLSGELKIKRAQSYIIRIIGVFIGINVLLSLR